MRSFATMRGWRSACSAGPHRTGAVPVTYFRGTPGMKEPSMDRRAFAQTLVALPFGIFLVRCSTNVSDHTSSGPEVVGDTIVYTSTTVENHLHTFTIDRGDYADPPSNGVAGDTSLNEGH